MKNLKPLLLVIFVAAAVAIIGYAYPIFKDRYGNKTADNTNINANENKSSIIDNLSGFLGSGNENDNANQNLNGNLNENQNQNQNQNTNANANANVSRDQLNSKDCDNHCVRFKDNPDNLAYCQQVCGDADVTEKNSLVDCANLTGDQKDYCVKDYAVGKEDQSLCNQIVDAKIKKTCKNRINEDLMN